jgi:Domain of unknown function (DUF4082)
MKKFYFSIFTVVLLLSSFLSNAQVYISINDGNPNGYTLDDPRFWVGGIVPPNPCTGCTIKIFSTVSMVPSGGNTSSIANVFTNQVPTDPDGHQDLLQPHITVGMRFQSALSSSVTGVRFYKLPDMTGTHTGVLYNVGGGAPLATVTFTGETATGWQDQKFTTPVPIIAGTTYVIAVYMDNGFYTADLHGLDAPLTSNGVVTSLGNTANPPNGVFDYGTGAPSFPNTGFNGSNYWVDVDVSVDGTFLNDIVLNNSTINVYGTTNLSINTYLELKGTSNITIGNDPTSVENIFINSQVDVSPGSSFTMANSSTSINANNDLGFPVIGPHLPIDGSGPPTTPGLYGILTVPIGGFGYTNILNQLAIGTAANQFANYTLNCSGSPPNFCAAGIVYGPATTGPTPPPATPDFGIIFNQSVTLPVVLVQFIANKDADGSVKLSWATSQEINAGYTDIERSGDQTGWIKIGSVKAKGNSSTTTDYSYSDKLPLDGVGYYRLKLVDLDGKYVYSKTISVTGDKNAVPLVIYSNPFSDLIRLKVNVSRAQNLTMTVSDMMGKVYISKSLQAQAGDNLVNLQPAVIGGSGMYILRISGDSYNQTAKIEKQ